MPRLPVPAALAGRVWLPGLVVVAAALALAVALVRAAAGEPLGAATRIAFGPYLALALWPFWLYGPLVLVPANGLQLPS